MPDRFLGEHRPHGFWQAVDNRLWWELTLLTQIILPPAEHGRKLAAVSSS